MTHHLSRRLELPHPVEKVFDFFSKAENLGRITPPSMHFRVLTPGPIAIATGTLIDYELRVFFFRLRWRTEIVNWDPPHQFVDSQLRGPYRVWVHTHRFMPTSKGTAVLDDVRYELPFSPLGDVAYPLVRLQLDRIFAFRASTVRRLLDEPH